MSQYYNPKRTRNIFEPESRQPFRISRSKIDLFLECPRCFYLDRRLGVERPGGFPFSLNNAVDLLLKKEFDIHRAKGSKHPLMEEYGIDAIPYAHEKINDWRSGLKGIEYLDEETNLLITGAVDDIWINPGNELIVVDYKATSKEGEVNIDADWQISYKRQIEIYQWLLRQNGFNVSDIGYFVYCNGNTDKRAFDKKIEFDIKVIPYKGDDRWIDGAIKSLYNCLSSNKIPESGNECDFCRYRQAVKQAE